MFYKCKCLAPKIFYIKIQLLEMQNDIRLILGETDKHEFKVKIITPYGLRKIIFIQSKKNFSFHTCSCFKHKLTFTLKTRLHGFMFICLFIKHKLINLRPAATL